jgi:hypothetical protein
MLLLLAALLLTIALVWNAFDIRRRLGVMQKEIDKLPMMRREIQDLQMMQSRLFLTGLNGRPSNRSTLNKPDATAVVPIAPTAKQSEDDAPLSPGGANGVDDR